MLGEDAEAGDNRQSAPEFRGPVVLDLLRPAVLAALAMVVSLGLSGAWPPANQLLLHRSIDLLVVLMYLGQLVRQRSGLFEALGICLTAVGFGFLVFKGVWLMPWVLLFMAVLWLLLTWVAEGWPLQRGLGVLALFWVVLRLAVVAMRAGGHGAAWSGMVDVLFLVLLAVMGFTSLRAWRERRFAVPPLSLFQAGLSGSLLGAAALTLECQKALADGRLQAPGSEWAGLGNLVVALLAGLTAWSARRWMWGGLRWLPPALAVLPLNQVMLGLYAKVSDNALVASFYRVNGLLVLVMASLWLCLVWAELGRQRQPEAGEPS